MKVSLIAAVSDNGVIGDRDGLPWRLPADLARFKRVTMGHHILMGRKTWDSIGRALPGRVTVVISRGRPSVPEGVRVAGSIERALEIARRGGDREAFVVGGGEIFAQALPFADRLYLTRVRASFDGDARFPELDPRAWRLVSSEEREADERNPQALAFETYERRRES